MAVVGYFPCVPPVDAPAEARAETASLPRSADKAPVLSLIGEDRPPYHYIIARADLPLGDLCAQIIHAAGESAGGPLADDTRAIALTARDEEHLLQIAARLDVRGIVHRLIREPDAPFNGAATAIGIPPTRDRAPIRRALSSLPLIR